MIDEIEGAFSATDAEGLTGLIRQIAKEGMIVVEVGSWFGRSTSVIVEAIRAFNGVVYCVDHWQGMLTTAMRQSCTT